MSYKYPVYFNASDKLLEILGEKNMVLAKGRTVEELIQDFSKRSMPVQTPMVLPQMPQTPMVQTQIPYAGQSQFAAFPQKPTGVLSGMRGQLANNFTKTGKRLTNWVRRGGVRNTRKSKKDNK